MLCLPQVPPAFILPAFSLGQPLCLPASRRQVLGGHLQIPGISGQLPSVSSGLFLRSRFHLPSRQPYGLVQLGLQHLSRRQLHQVPATLISFRSSCSSSIFSPHSIWPMGISSPGRRSYLSSQRPGLMPDISTHILRISAFSGSSPLHFTLYPSKLSAWL